MQREFGFLVIIVCIMCCSAHNEVNKTLKSNSCFWKRGCRRLYTTFKKIITEFSMMKTNCLEVAELSSQNKQLLNYFMYEHQGPIS